MLNKIKSVSMISIMITSICLVSCSDLIVITDSFPQPNLQSNNTLDGLKETTSEAPQPVSTPTESIDRQEILYESPILGELSSRGELPPYAERLPDNPLVINHGVDQAEYEGALRWGFIRDPIWSYGLYFIAWESLVSWNSDFSGVIPDIADKIEISNNSSIYTFSLRRGLKWSDGTPFSTRDIQFYLDDVLFDPDVNSGGPLTEWLPYDMATDFRYDVLDDYTIRFIFPKPNGAFLLNLATISGIEITLYPAHYCSQFHLKYNSGVNELARSTSGVRDWVDLLNRKCGLYGSWYNNVERPTLFAWKIEESTPQGNGLIFRRNPFYWKVDHLGRQLPYIDEIHPIAFADQQSIANSLVTGEIDSTWSQPKNFYQFYLDAESSGYPITLSRLQSDAANTATIHFNRTTSDSRKADLFASKEFRAGVSHAINRQFIIDSVFGNSGHPSQVSPLEDSVLYNQRLANQFLEYDLELSNQYLDSVIPTKDDLGFRLFPDGTRVSFILSAIDNLPWTQKHPQIASIIADNLLQVGLEVVVDVRNDVQIGLSKRKNELEGLIYSGEGGAGLSAILLPQYYVPMEFWGVFGNGWYYWVNDTPGSVKVEPPQDIIDIRSRFDNEVLGTQNGENQIIAMRQILEFAADQFWVMGISQPDTDYLPHSSRLMNIPDDWVMSRLTGGVKLTSPETWYIVKE